MLSHGDKIIIKATPKAKQNSIVRQDDSDGQRHYRIHTTAIPDNGKANEAIIKMLAKELGIAKSKLVLIRGETARDKIIEYRK